MLGSGLRNLTLNSLSYQQHEWQGSKWRQQPTVDEDRSGQMDTNLGPGNVIILGENDKGILGPGPADLRFPEPL